MLYAQPSSSPTFWATMRLPHPPPPAPWPPPVRASDSDRERTVALLHEHCLAGRLTLPELEARCEEAWRAQFIDGLWYAVRELPVATPLPGPRPQEGAGSAITALSLGVVGTCVLLFSFGLLFVISLPATAGAWVAGRNARRRTPASGPYRGLALAGEMLGAVGTLLGCLALAGCALIIAS
ncbi:MAG: DUF1707 SHOCT-like domain-containing protein [Solirubrobacteraceae bacterium]